LNKFQSFKQVKKRKIKDYRWDIFQKSGTVPLKSARMKSLITNRTHLLGKILSVFCWCKLNDGELQLINFQKVFVDRFRKRAPRLFHRCLFVERHKFYNLTTFVGPAGMIPLGGFQLVMQGIDKDKKLLMTLTSTFKIF